MGNQAAEPEPCLDGEGVAALFDRHYPQIHAYLRRRLSTEPARELAAETFLVAYRRRADFDPARGEALPWLFGIAANLMRGERRRERRELRAYARTGIDPVVADPDEPERRLDARADGPRLAAALADLPHENREVLLLFAWAELSYEEISTALGIPVGTVRSRMARGRARLLGRLDPEPRAADVASTEGSCNA
jgi:RNA polymerase sigma-70 factor, ECF subfamily